MSGFTLARLAGVPVAQIGASKPEALEALGVRSVADLLTFYPRRVVDRRTVTPIAELVDGSSEAVILAKVGRIRTGPKANTVIFFDETGRMMASFFGQGWVTRRLREGAQVAVIGRPKRWENLMTMTNPLVDLVGDQHGGLFPVYPQSESAPITSLEIGKLVNEALERWERRGVPDPLDDDLRAAHKLISRSDAFRSIHFPESDAQRFSARRRLAFDELLRIQLKLALERRERDAAEQAIRHPQRSDLVTKFVASLPYPLTGAQNRVVREIGADMAGPHAMHRLLQGDVGAGKSVCATATLLRSVDGGRQAALMAPTEILARQLHAGVAAACAPLGIRCELLRSKMKAAERRAILEGLADGSVQIAVGTHALLEAEVVYRDLGVVVVDEQHRFGVEQRQALRAANPNGTVPDTLVMTATPIPRTMAMTVYGDLTVSVLDELPPGRTPIVTKWSPQETEAMAAVRRAVAGGRQAYVVCSLVEGSEVSKAKSVTEVAERLAGAELAGLRVGVVHGKLKAAEKDAVMSSFRDGALDVLVSTTVIEVGVDVPNSTVMVILDADRFGIAQLHQLRGRVGRGKHASECWLVAEPPEGSDQPSERIAALVASTDGFELAEADLKLRGEGQTFGTGQSGRSDLKLARLSLDRALCERARDVAGELVAAGLGVEWVEELGALCAEMDVDRLKAS